MRLSAHRDLTHTCTPWEAFRSGLEALAHPQGTDAAQNSYSKPTVTYIAFSSGSRMIPRDPVLET